jgi:hypothetical protein
MIRGQAPRGESSIYLNIGTRSDFEYCQCQSGTAILHQRVAGSASRLQATKTVAMQLSGFNLGESELTIAANVDSYFFGDLTASVSGDNEISIEEAYFRTTALTHGLTIKGGRFFSGLDYLNDVHARAWDFVDQPLVYQALPGNHARCLDAGLESQ